MRYVRSKSRRFDAEGDAFAPPKGLSEEARKIWAAQVPRYSRSPGRLAMLRIGLEAMDEADEARRILKRDGIVRDTPGGRMAPHPAAAIERAARADFYRIWRTLKLDWCQSIDG